MPTTGLNTGLTNKRCVACEGGIPQLNRDQIEELLPQISDWEPTAGYTIIRREWTARNFAEAAHFFAEVATLAEAEGHHPDFHLTNYRQVAIDLTTHAVGGLTENDFILAAKIDAIPFEVKKSKPPSH